MPLSGGKLKDGSHKVIAKSPARGPGRDTPGHMSPGAASGDRSTGPHPGEHPSSRRPRRAAQRDGGRVWGDRCAAHDLQRGAHRPHGPDLLDGVVQLRPEHDRQPQQEGEQQERDRGGQRAVGVAGGRQHGEVDAQPRRRGDEDQHRQQGTRQQPPPRRAVRQRGPVDGGEHEHQEHPDTRVVERLDDRGGRRAPGLGEQPRQQVRAQRDQRQREHRDHQRAQVDQQREQALPHRVAHPVLAVRLRDRVDHRRDGRRPRPQGDEEPDRDHVGTSAGEDARGGRGDELVHHLGGEHPVGEPDDLALDDVDGLGPEPAADVAQRAQQAQEQRRQGQGLPERGLRGHREDPVVPRLAQRAPDDAGEGPARARGRGVGVRGHRNGSGGHGASQDGPPRRRASRGHGRDAPDDAVPQRCHSAPGQGPRQRRQHTPVGRPGTAAVARLP